MAIHPRLGQTKPGYEKPEGMCCRPRFTHDSTPAMPQLWDGDNS